MPYASASDVAAYCQVLISPEESFSDSTCPTLTQVARFLTSGCAIIEANISAKGYSTPIASGTGAYDLMTDLNTLYGAAQAHMTRTVGALARQERTQGQIFETLFWQRLDRYLNYDLTIFGLSRSSVAPLYTGGISISDKQAVDEDTDRVPARFRRGQFATPGTTRPDDVTDPDDLWDD